MLRTFLYWLLRLLRAGARTVALPPARGDLFDPEERMIYTHLVGFTPDGEKVFAQKDPMALWRKLMEQGAAIDADIKVARSPSKAAAERYAALAAKLRAIFDVKPLGQGGLSDPLLMQLFAHFIAYGETLKKNPPPTSTPPSGTSPPGPPTPAPAASSPDTPSTSDSGSTDTAPSTGSPTPPASA